MLRSSFPSSTLVFFLFIVRSFVARAFVLEIPSGVIGEVGNIGIENDGTAEIMRPRVDCHIGEWSAWEVAATNLATDEGATTFVRSRQILLAAQNGGEQCPSLYDTRTVQRGESFDPNAREEPKTTTTRTTTTTTKTTTTTTTLPPTKPTTTDMDFGVESFKKRDILFLVDMSGSLSETEFGKVMDSLALIVDRLCEEVTPGQSSPLRIAMATFDHRLRTNFDFKTYNNKDQIKSALKMTRPLGGATCTGEALQYAADVMFQVEKGSRPDATKDVLLLTDGLWNCGVDAQMAAEKLKQKANIYSLLIGHFTPSGFQQMHSLLSGPSETHLFSLRNVDQLHHLIYLLEADFPLKPFRGCAPARLEIEPKHPGHSIPGSTIVVPEFMFEESKQSTIVVPDQEKSSPSQLKTTIGQVTNAPVQQTKIPLTPGQVKTTIGQVTNTPPAQLKTTRPSLNARTPGQSKTSLGQLTNTPGQAKTTSARFVGQEKTTIGQFTHTPGQAKTTAANFIGQEKTTIGQFTHTPGQAKTTLSNFGRTTRPSLNARTPGQSKTSVGQLTNTPGQAKTTSARFVGQEKTTIGQFTHTPGQAKTTAANFLSSSAGQEKTTWPWQQKTTRNGQFTFGPYQRTTDVGETPGQEKTTIGQLKTSVGVNRITTGSPSSIKG